jgi:hypothetical protein
MKKLNPKRTVVILVAMLMSVVLAASSCNNEPSKQRQELQKQSSDTFDKQRAAVPFPGDELVESLERRNLAERLRRFNEPNKIGYVYYVPFGNILGYWTIKGKVSSTQSQMNPSDELTDDLSDCQGCFESQVLESAGDDGSFGPNEAGVFFFTTNGTMVQIPEDDYFYSDQPVTLGADIVNLDNK